jgi:hypothetical protein
MLVGLGLFFVPSPVLSTVFGVEIPTGRGLVPIADVDTLFIDLSLVALGIVVWRRRHALRERLPLACFLVLLTTVTVVLVGYVVTNFGTLWRLRAMAMVPLWLLPLALSPEKPVDPA